MTIAMRTASIATSSGCGRNRTLFPARTIFFRSGFIAFNGSRKRSLGKGRQETFFVAVTEEDLARERQVEDIVRENLSRWQDEGLVPDMQIEPGEKTDEPIRTRGWTHWHHLFGATADYNSQR